MINFETDREKYAWLAGLLDGEGCLSIRTTVWKKSDDYLVGKSYMPVMLITNSDMGLLQEVLEQCKLPNRIYVNRPSNHGRLGKKPQGEVIFCPEKIREFLPKMMPFLVIKKRQAEIILEMLDRKKNRGKDFIEKHGRIAYFEACVKDKAEIMHLNRPTKY